MEHIEISKIKEVYNLLCDDISKYIFENRFMYSVTEDTKFIRNVACTIDTVRGIYNYIKSSPLTKVIFGSGSVGKRLVHIYGDIEFECFVDNKCAGQTYRGLPIISMKELKDNYSKALIIISTNNYHKEIMQQLLEEGFKEEQIVNIGMEYEKLNHLQYFDLPQLEDKRAENEVFVDGGCYDGNNSIDFMKWNGRKGDIIAWEPDPDNQKKCKQLLEEYSIKYTLIPKGLWSEAGELQFKMDGTSSALSECGDIKVAVDSIDSMLNTLPTFIKMDIEGAEYRALLGAKSTISKYKPKLAICVYHKLEDIVELPYLIHKINPEYTFYLRHYSFCDVETVLYAL